MIGKPPAEVTSADVLGFITAQRAGSDGRRLRVVDEVGGLSARTVRRRLSGVSGLFAYLLAGGDVSANRSLYRLLLCCMVMRQLSSSPWSREPHWNRRDCIDPRATEPLLRVTRLSPLCGIVQRTGSYGTPSPS